MGSDGRRREKGGEEIEASAESAPDLAAAEEEAERTEDEVADEAAEAEATEEEGAEEEAAEEAPEQAALPEVPPAPRKPAGDVGVTALPASALVLLRHRPGPLAMLKLEKVNDDATFRLRDSGEVDTLATSIAKLGQLFPVDLRLRPPDRFQVITGFRRVEALRLLKRERVLARVHTDLSDEDALRLALADVLEQKPVDREELIALRERLEAEDRLTPVIQDTLDRVISPPDEELAPETVGEESEEEEEVDLDTLAQDVIGRLAAINQDLAMVAELWSSLEPALRDSLLEQLGYPQQLVGYLRSVRVR